MNAVVLDASAAVEFATRSALGRRLIEAVPAGTAWWVPNGLFDAEVNSVLRRLDLMSKLDEGEVDAARRRLATLRLRRVSVTALADRAWALRYNFSFYDATYVALADVLGVSLVTADVKLAQAPNIPVPTIHPQ